MFKSVTEIIWGGDVTDTHRRTQPIIVKDSRIKISNFYMCSTPSLPSVTSWSTSFTNTSSWKFSPALVDLFNFVNELLLLLFVFTLVIVGDGGARRTYQVH